MKIHTRAFPLTERNPSDISPAAEHFGADFEPPEGAHNANAQVLIVNGDPQLVVTWIELSPAELNELRYHAARMQGGPPPGGIIS